MNKTELTDHILKPENRQYIEMSLSGPWGLSNYIAESNGLKYVHRGVKQIDEKIVIPKECKDMSYSIDGKLIDFIQPFSEKELSGEKRDLTEIVKGRNRRARHTLGFFIGLMWSLMGLNESLQLLKDNDDSWYYWLAGSVITLSYGIYSTIALSRRNMASREYNIFLSIIDAAENTDYFINKNMSKELFERIK